LHPQSGNNTGCDGSEKGFQQLENWLLKNFSKKVSKRFGSLEKLPYLCNRFPLLKSERETEKLIDFGLEIQIRSLRYLSS
jgi:hypothetical protein